MGNRGIAEVVGTLMLVLIVVAASIALAAFVASYQKQLQAQQAEAHQRNLESLKVLDVTGVTPQPSPNQLMLGSFSFVLASEFVNPSTVASISVNGNPLAHFLVQNVSPSGGVPFCYDDSTQFILPSFQQVEVTVNLLSSGTCPNGFFSPTTTLLVNSYLQIDLITILQNTFTTVFLPPTAIPLIGTVSEFIGAQFRNVPVLDGSTSFQQGNGTIVSWTWSVVNTTGGLSPPPQTYSGEKLIAPFASTQTGQTFTFTIALSVQNSNGLIGSSSINYTYLT
jgi:flagellin-like protein